ncbi:MAG: alpha/beta hydrolase [Syntrophobacteraceae bacterium]
MSTPLHADYGALDQPLVLERLFHPRPEWSAVISGVPAEDVLIDVAGGVRIGGRFHAVSKTAPTILFFHGNGEIVSDYDDMGPVYNRMGINFFPVDYRGYGRSSGSPTVRAMMTDCHAIFEYVRRLLAERGYSRHLILMGRSLGSASVLELASSHPEEIDALIVESGFAYAAPLLRLLGIDPDRIGFKEETGFRNVDKIGRFAAPTLVIHAEHDHIIPYSDGEALYAASRAPDKTLLKIPGADHNDIFLRGMTPYMSAVKSLAERATAAGK